MRGSRVARCEKRNMMSATRRDSIRKVYVLRLGSAYEKDTDTFSKINRDKTVLQLWLIPVPLPNGISELANLTFGRHQPKQLRYYNRATITIPEDRVVVRRHITSLTPKNQGPWHITVLVNKSQITSLRRWAPGLSGRRRLGSTLLLSTRLWRLSIHEKRSCRSRRD
jgi:hypothetical protein